MKRTRAPDKRISEILLQRPMDLIAHVLDRRVLPDDESILKVWLCTFAVGMLVMRARDLSWVRGNRHVRLCVYPHQSQFLPAPFDNFLDAQIQLAAHDACVGFSRQLVEKLDTDAVDLVVNVETVQRLAVGLSHKQER